MKKLHPLLPLLLFIISCSKPINEESLVERNGIYYQVNSEIPYSGVFLTFHDNGQKRDEETYKDGKKDGLHYYWHDNGQKGMEETYKNGKRDGLSTRWQWDGQKRSENTYENGKKDGLSTVYHRNYDDNRDENLSKAIEGVWKDGIRISYKSWNRDGSVKDDGKNYESQTEDEVFDDLVKQLNKKK